MGEKIMEGIKVVEPATYIAGLDSDLILADFGTDVVKIEPPK